MKVVQRKFKILVTNHGTRTWVQLAMVALLSVGMAVAQTGGTGTGGTGTGGTGGTGAGATGSGPVDISGLQSALGMKGSVENGVASFEFVRTDVRPTIKGQGVKPEILARGFFKFFTTTDSAGTTGGTSTTPTNGTTTGTTSATTPGPSAAVTSTIMTAEIPLQEKEVQGLVKALSQTQNGITISAIHNHALEENPRIIFAHLEGAGDGSQLATTVRSALQEAGLNIKEVQQSTSMASLDVSGIQTALGGQGHVEDNAVLEVIIPRSETITSCAALAAQLANGTVGSTGTSPGTGSTGTVTTEPETTGTGATGTTGTPEAAETSTSFSPAAQAIGSCLASPFTNSGGTTGGATTGAESTETGMQVPAELAAFSEVDIQPSANGKSALVSGELALFSTEIQPTIQALQQAGFNVTAVHNHTVYTAPNLYYVHFWQSGDAMALSRQISRAMGISKPQTGQQP